MSSKLSFPVGYRIITNIYNHSRTIKFKNPSGIMKRVIVEEIIEEIKDSDNTEFNTKKPRVEGVVFRSNPIKSLITKKPALVLVKKKEVTTVTKDLVQPAAITEVIKPIAVGLLLLSAYSDSDSNDSNDN